MKLGHWILEGEKLKEVDLMTWARWFEASDRCVASDDVSDSRISTVFIGLDHNFGLGPPLLFETMVFGGPLDQECERYSTLEGARRGHEEMVQRVKSAKVAGPEGDIVMEEK
jgi:hypothetical protein